MITCKKKNKKFEQEREILECTVLKPFFTVNGLIYLLNKILGICPVS